MPEAGTDEPDLQEAGCHDDRTDQDGDNALGGKAESGKASEPGRRRRSA
jgi:hypothetical protein